MHPIDLLGLVGKNLARRKGRAALTAMGVLVGTASVVVLLSLGAGLQQVARDQFARMRNLDQVQVMANFGISSNPDAAGDNRVRSDPLDDEMVAAFGAIPGVEGVYPVQGLEAAHKFKADQLEAPNSVSGVLPEHLKAVGCRLEDGHMLLERGKVVFGSAAANNFSDPRQAGGRWPDQPELVDQMITLVVIKKLGDEEITRRYRLQVAGVVSDCGFESDAGIYMHLDEVMAINQWVNGTPYDVMRTSFIGGGYDYLVVDSQGVEVVLDVAETIAGYGYITHAAQAVVQGMSGFFVALQAVFAGIGAVSLAVASLSIANTMTAAIVERTPEIGLMKALGASNTDVLAVFLGEAGGIGLAGGLAGAGTGWCCAQLVNLLGIMYLTGQSWQGFLVPARLTVTPAWLFASAVAFAALISLLAGIYPALRAASMTPIQALKA